MRVPYSSRPSSRCVEVGWLARPTRCSEANSQSPDRSPVKTRPVRLAPWAAGASPTIRMRGSVEPQPGIGSAPVRLPGVRRPLLARHLLAPARPAAGRPGTRRRARRPRPARRGRRAGPRRRRTARPERSPAAERPVVRVARAGRGQPDVSLHRDVLGLPGSGLLDPAGVADRQLERLLGGDADLQLTAALELGVELGAEQQRDVGDPQPQQGDDDAGDRAVGLVVGAEAAPRSRRSPPTRPARPGSPRTTRPR